jgi:hypothetical protein
MNRFACTVVIALAAAAAAALSGGCDASAPGPPNGGHHAFVVAQPPEAAMVGTYVLVDQTVVKGGLSAMQGRQGRLDLRTDGTFTVTNYPKWSDVSSGGADKFASFISTSGRWAMDRVGTTYDYGPNPNACWGITFFVGTPGSAIHQAPTMPARGMARRRRQRPGEPVDARSPQRERCHPPRTRRAFR